jgi:hypothetical protein
MRKMAGRCWGSNWPARLAVARVASVAGSVNVPGEWFAGVKISRSCCGGTLGR